MGEGFKKFKKKFLLRAIIKSAVCGLSFGLFAVGIILLALKLSGIPLNAGYYVLIGVGAAIICGGLSFLLFRPVDKKIAVRLDTQYALNERVQTALAYTEAEGTVVEMLQSDTDARLKSLPREKFNFAKVWQYFLIGILAIAMAVSAFMVPAKVVEGGVVDGEVEDPPYTFTDEQMDALQELIDNVKSSPLDDALKTPTVDSLNKLMNNLMFAETDSEMQSYVNGTVSSVEKVIKEPLSYKTLANALGNVGQVELAQMIADGVQVYKEYPITDYDDVEFFYEERENGVTEAIEYSLSEYLDSLMEVEQASRAVRDDAGEPSEGEGGEDSVSIIVKTYGDIYMALNLSTAAEDDVLRGILFNFAQGMAQSDNTLTNDTAMIFEIQFNRELAAQSYLLAMNKYITNTLRDIFGLPIPADENFVPTLVITGDRDKTDGEKKGGYGDGGMLYGSDDKVYDPSTNSYVTYGELFNYYYAIVEDILREGNLSEEQQAVVRQYFEILLSGLES